MSVEVIAQVATLVLAVLAIIWHQQRGNDKLRDDFTTANGKLRDDLTLAHDKLRDDLTLAHDKLRDEVVGNGQRLARIEGFLRIGVPAEAAPPESLPAAPAAPADPSDPSDPASAAAEPIVEPAPSA